MQSTVFDNIEIQCVGKGAGARRFRYHQAMLDSHSLKKNTPFDSLPNLYIIFILEHDIFEKGLPIYFVNKTLNIKDEDDNYLPFDDGCNIMYINGDYRGDDALGKLMHDFSTPNADEMYYDELARRVSFHKQDEKGVQNMCQIIEEYGDERAAEAAHETKIKSAQNALAMNILPEQVSQITGLPLEEVLALKTSLDGEGK